MHSRFFLALLLRFGSSFNASHFYAESSEVKVWKGFRK